MIFSWLTHKTEAMDCEPLALYMHFNCLPECILTMCLFTEEAHNNAIIAMVGEFLYTITILTFRWIFSSQNQT